VTISISAALIRFLYQFLQYSLLKSIFNKVVCPVSI